ncbi:hypothetical protein RR48_08038 [Papilio machaon]|uniref:Uncharacterized protein n=1 Tax=Papilio machaon TaxID=76193 RepID=A0A194R211_PAPMA|nr:hypothetical protein RR48_08038 [Papilio machaon]
MLGRKFRTSAAAHVLSTLHRYPQAAPNGTTELYPCERSFDTRHGIIGCGKERRVMRVARAEAGAGRLHHHLSQLTSAAVRVPLFRLRTLDLTSPSQAAGSQHY